MKVDHEKRMRLAGVVPTVLLAGAFAVAWRGDVRIVLAVLMGVLAMRRAAVGIRWSREAQERTLVAVFGLCFVVAPLWTAGQSRWAQFVTAFAIVVAGGLILTAFRHVSETWHCEMPPGTAIDFGLLAVCAFALQYRLLGASLTYYGDSDFHVGQTYLLLDYFARGPVLAATAAGLAVLLPRTRRWRGVQLGTATVCFLLAGYAAVQGQAPTGWFLRYPAAFYYLNAVASLPGQALHNRGFAFDEGLYRLSSWLGVVALATVAAHTQRHRPPAIRMAVGVGVLTIPLTAFYASLTYIEVPLLAAMAVALFRHEADEEAFASTGRFGPGFVALAFLAFFKETLLVWLVIQFTFLTQSVWRRPDGLWLQKVWRMMAAGVLLLSPLAVFLLIRPPLRTWDPHLSHLLNLDNIMIVVRAIWQQTGVVSILVPVAGWICWRHGRRRTVVLCLALVFGYLVFFLVDRDIARGFRYPGPEYLGYSRFTLYMLVPALVVCLEALACVRRGSVVGAAIVSVLLANVLLSPVRPWSANRGVFWSDATIPAADVAAPYDDFFAWLSTRPERALLVLGRTYRYQDWFYFMKYRIAVVRFDAPLAGSPEETAALDRRDAYDLVVLQRETQASQETGRGILGGREVARFETDAVQLLAYEPVR